MEKNRPDLSNNSLDILKTLCAIFIVGMHVAPVVPNEFANILLVQLIFRCGVPVFFISSGFFFSKMDDKSRSRYLKRILIVYAVSSLLYLPYTLQLYMIGAVGVRSIIRVIVFGNGHLWYMVSLFVSLLLWHIAGRIRFIRSISDKVIIILAIAVLMIGAFFDEYYHIIDNPVTTGIGTFIDRYGTTRSAVFMGIPLVLIGRHIRSHQEILRAGKMRSICILIMSTAASFGELMFILHNTPEDRSPSCDLTFFNWISPVILFILAMSNAPFRISRERSRDLRKTAVIVYVIHPFIRDVPAGWFRDCRYMLQYVAVLILSYFLAYISLKLIRMIIPTKLIESEG